MFALTIAEVAVSLASVGIASASLMKVREQASEGGGARMSSGTGPTGPQGLNVAGPTGSIGHTGESSNSSDLTGPAGPAGSEGPVYPLVDSQFSMNNPENGFFNILLAGSSGNSNVNLRFEAPLNIGFPRTIIGHQEVLYQMSSQVLNGQFVRRAAIYRPTSVTSSPPVFTPAIGVTNVVLSADSTMVSGSFTADVTDPVGSSWQIDIASIFPGNTIIGFITPMNLASATMGPIGIFAFSFADFFSINQQIDSVSDGTAVQFSYLFVFTN